MINLSHNECKKLKFFLNLPNYISDLLRLKADHRYIDLNIENHHSLSKY